MQHRTDPHAENTPLGRLVNSVPVRVSRHHPEARGLSAVIDHLEDQAQAADEQGYPETAQVFRALLYSITVAIP